MLALSLRHGWGCKENQGGAVALLKKSISTSLSSLGVLAQRIPMDNSPPNDPDDFPIIEFDLPLEELENQVSDIGQTSFTPKGSLPMLDRTPSTHSIGLVSRLSEVSLRIAGKSEPSLADDVQIIKNLLPLPLYELGNCYRFGWGVKSSLKTAARLYTFSARLGDLESQLALTHLYAHESSKFRESKSKIAFWLRQAEQEGWSSFNETWIWKKKYDLKTGEKGERLLSGDVDLDADMIVEMLEEYRTLFHEPCAESPTRLDTLKSHICLFSACKRKSIT
jgi:hypothetical protein